MDRSCRPTGFGEAVDNRGFNPFARLGGKDAFGWLNHSLNDKFRKVVTDIMSSSGQVLAGSSPPVRRDFSNRKVEPPSVVE